MMERVTGENLQRGKGPLNLSGTMGRWSSWLWWWCHRYKHVKSSKLHLNMCRFLYVNCTSIKLFKNNYSTVENSMEGAQNTETRTTKWPCNPSSGCLSAGNELAVFKHIWNLQAASLRNYSMQLTPPPRQAALNRLEVTGFLFNNKWTQKKIAIKFKWNNRGLFILYKSFQFHF